MTGVVRMSCGWFTYQPQRGCFLLSHLKPATAGKKKMPPLKSHYHQAFVRRRSENILGRAREAAATMAIKTTKMKKRR